MIVSGLSGNELYCLAEKGWAPGSIVVGNSVQSLGFVGGLSSGLRTIAGGEIENLTKLITEGRHAAIGRLEKEAQQQGAHGVTGVTSDLKQVAGLKEFLGEIGVKSLNFYSDNKADVFQVLKQDGKVLGLPTTILVGKDGCEIGTLAGPAQWDSGDGLALIEAMKG